MTSFRTDLAAVCVIAFLWLGCGSSSTPTGQESSLSEPPSDASVVQTETLVETSLSGITSPQRTVLGDRSSFADWWSIVHSVVAPAPPAPEVDFDGRSVAAAAMGQRSTGGHAIEITEVRRDGEELWVVVMQTTPAEGCTTTQAMTAPVTAVTVPAVDGDVHFVEREETLTC